MILSVNVTPAMTFAEFREVAAANYLRSVLQRASGDMQRGAKLAGMNRTAFSERVARARLTDYARGLRLAAVDLKHARERPALPGMEILSKIRA